MKLEDETVWLTQAQMVELFHASKQNVSLHINNIFKEGELQKIATVKYSLTVHKEVTPQKNLEKNKKIQTSLNMTSDKGINNTQRLIYKQLMLHIFRIQDITSSLNRRSYNNSIEKLELILFYQ